MVYRIKWRPSKAKGCEFAETMEDIHSFCKEHGIDYSINIDSYYFHIDGQAYRVSNHSVEASNSHAYDCMGNKVREVYHPGGRRKDVIYIHAGKTRIREIYNDLKAGYQLDGRGNRKNQSP